MLFTVHEQHSVQDLTSITKSTELLSEKTYSYLKYEIIIENCN